MFQPVPPTADPASDEVPLPIAATQHAIGRLAAQLDRLHDREIVPGNWSGMEMVAAQSARVASALARLVQVQINGALARDKLRHGTAKPARRD